MDIQEFRIALAKSKTYELLMKRPMPLQPTDAPKDTVWVGGPIPWFSISLSISAEDLDPDEITRLLGIQPTKAWRKGVPQSGRAGREGRVPTFGRWSTGLRRDETTEWDVEEAISLVLDRILVKDEVWKQVVSNSKARIFVGLTLDTYNRGFGFAPSLLKRIAELGLMLDFDIYAEVSASNEK
jgi:hypothetical protein